MDRKNPFMNWLFLGIVIALLPVPFQPRSYGEPAATTSIVSVRPEKLEGYEFHHPAYSPNSERIAFSVAKANSWSHSTIWVQDLKSGNSWPVTRSDSTGQTGDVCVQWSPDGEKLSFGSDKNGEVHIYIVNVDGSNLKQITEEPISYGWGWYGISSWSKDGKKIIYPQEKTDSHASGIHEYDLSTNTSKILYEFPEKSISDPDLSPDGNKVVYVVGEGLEILDLITKSTQKLECDIAGARMPKWSPNGQWIGFQVNSGSWKTYILPVESGKAIRVGPGNNYTTQVPSWSSDGNSIVYHGKKHDTQRVVIKNLNASEIITDSKNVIIRDWQWATWSQSGQYLAYITSNIENDEIYTLSVLDLSNTSFTHTRLMSKISSLNYSIPQWKSKIGGWLDGEDRFVAIVQDNESTQLALISAQTVEITKLTESRSIKSNPIISSDGELLAYSSNVEGVEEIWIYDLITGENYQLTFSGSDSDRGASFTGKWELRFSPSGDKILFGQDNGNTKGDIMMVEVGSGQITQITSEKGWDVNPYWIDEVTVSYTTHPPESHRYIGIKSVVDNQVTTIDNDMNIWNPFWHAQSETFYFNNQRDNDGIMTVSRSGEFNTLLKRGTSGIPSPSGQYIAHLERIGESALMDIWVEKIDNIVSASAIP